MSKGVIYLLGVITGIFIMLGTAFVVAKTRTTDADGVSMFEKRGQAMAESSFKIFQTLDDTHALARGVSNEEFGSYYGVTVMVVGGEEDHFYDDLIIRKSSRRKFYQVGTYRYQTKSEDFKTVPIVALLDIK